jgi:hypothetical protein
MLSASVHSIPRQSGMIYWIVIGHKRCAIDDKYLISLAPAMASSAGCGFGTSILIQGLCLLSDRRAAGRGTLSLPARDKNSHPPQGFIHLRRGAEAEWIKEVGFGIVAVGLARGDGDFLIGDDVASSPWQTRAPASPHRTG